MQKIIQIATSAASNGHCLYALTEDGKLYERVYYNTEGIAQEWKEILESVPDNNNDKI